MAEDKEIRVDEIRKLQRERRIKARRRNILIGIVSLTISVITLLLVIGLLLGGKAPPRYAFLEDGRFEESSTYTAVIRQRGVEILSPVSGIFVPTVGQGGRVARGGRIGLMVPQSQEALLNEARDARATLARRLLLDPADGNARTEALRHELRSSLDNTLHALRYDVSTGYTLQVADLVTELDAVLAPEVLSLPQGALDLPAAQTALTSYESAMSALEAVSEFVIAPDTGLVSYERMPRLIQAEAIDDTDDSWLDATLFSENLVTDLEVGEKRVGEPVATLLRTATPELVVHLPEKSRGDFPAENPTLNVRIDNEESYTSLTINDFVSVENGVVVMGMLPSSVANWRLIPQFEIDVRWNETTGLLVPMRSLLAYDPADNIAILMKVSAGQIHSVPVFVRDTDGELALIEGRVGDSLAPSQFDLYVVNPSAELDGAYID